MEKYTNSFEVYLQSDDPKDIGWKKFVNSVFEYDNDFALEINFEKSTVEFFLHTTKDLSKLTTKIYPFILKPWNAHSLAVAQAKKTLSLMSLPKDKSVIDIKEREELKKGNSLKKVLWYFRSYMRIRTNAIKFYFEKADGSYILVEKSPAAVPFYLLQGIDWASLVKYKKRDVPIYLKIGAVEDLFTQKKSEGLLEVDGFPYLSTQNYLSIKNYEFDKHTLIVGQTGVGKSKFIALFVKEMERMRFQDKYLIVIIDPHASLFSDINRVEHSIDIDFIKSSCDLFSKNSEPKIATELTIMLFKNLLGDQFNAKIEQVLKYSLYVLFSAKKMSLFNVKKFLTEYEYRAEVFNVADPEENMVHFFGTEYSEIRTKFYETAIMPIITLIDELNFLPVFGDNSSDALSDMLNENFVTSFSLSKIFLGERATKLIAGLLIQQIFLMAQSKSLRKKIITIIDEASIVQSDALVTILAEARKFNLSLFLSTQYLSQMDPAILKGILSSTFNYFVFRTSEEDAKILAKNMAISIPDEVLKQWKEKGETKDDLKVKLMTLLDGRSCIVRCYMNGKFYEVFKARTPNLGLV